MWELNEKIERTDEETHFYKLGLWLEPPENGVGRDDSPELLSGQTCISVISPSRFFPRFFCTFALLFSPSLSHTHTEETFTPRARWIHSSLWTESGLMHLSRRGQNIFIYRASIRTVTLNNNHHYPRLLLSQLTVTLAGRRTDVRVQQQWINQESKKLNMSAKLNKVKLETSRTSTCWQNLRLIMSTKPTKELN